MFPDSQASAAAATATSLAEQLRTLIAAHRRAAEQVLIGFEGEPREEFEGLLEMVLAGLQQHVDALTEQSQGIQADQGRAQTRAAERQAEQRRYDTRLSEWRAAQSAQPSGAR